LAIIGSANINDRSMLGERDSEVAVMIEDLDFIDGKMNGVDYKTGQFAHGLRYDLLKEHLGLVGDSEDEFEITINDPLAKSFLKGVHARAEINSVVFLTVFGPALFSKVDVEGSEALKRYNDFPAPRENTVKTRELLEHIKGHFVNYPCTFFIEKLNLKPSVSDFSKMYVHNVQSQKSATTYNV
jgi:phospholipase D1/2